MTPAEQVKIWQAAATKDDLLRLVAFLDSVSLEASVLIYQYACDPAGTRRRYERWMQP